MERNELRELLDLLIEKGVKTYSHGETKLEFHDSIFFKGMMEEQNQEVDEQDNFIKHLTEAYGVKHG